LDFVRVALARRLAPAAMLPEGSHRSGLSPAVFPAELLLLLQRPAPNLKTKERLLSRQPPSSLGNSYIRSQFDGLAQQMHAMDPAPNKRVPHIKVNPILKVIL
jgi:hypothetical protein